MNEYKNGYCKTITRQLGQSFLYDNTVVLSEYSKSVEADKIYDLHKRNIKSLVLGDRLPINVIKKENSVIIDMGKEVAGFLDIDIKSQEIQKLLIAYGEHLTDGNVRRIIGDRDFSVEMIAKRGENKYLNSLRRIAGRYIEIFGESEIKINYIGIRPVEYTVEIKEKVFSDELTQRIYDTSVYTLKCCMHEHYEDYPWREQALYTMDSRNQMLCGYYAFQDGNKDYARQNLIQILNIDFLLLIFAALQLSHFLPAYLMVSFSVCLSWDYPSLLFCHAFLRKSLPLLLLNICVPTVSESQCLEGLNAENIFALFHRSSNDVLAYPL
ncbi:MAG: family 78 glycoside hydrolase catalytic domain [Candidatus Borkfalkiaceae bacterium]|nr:family 78 glycoside hydrolase catalytic domain [Christensenellaceae bacterium]